MINLLSIREHSPYKLRNKNKDEKPVEFFRDRICLLLNENGTWELKVNEVKMKGKGWIELKDKMEELKQVAKRKTKTTTTYRRLVVWVDELPIYEDLFTLMLREEPQRIVRQNPQGDMILFHLIFNNFEIRNFKVFADGNYEKVKETFKFNSEGVDIMEDYLMAQETQNWCQMRWSAARCFTKRFNKKVQAKVKNDKTYFYEIADRKKTTPLYNSYVFRSPKGGLLWVNKNYLGKKILGVYDYDIHQAYGGAFVRANDFPIGTIKEAFCSLEHLRKYKWYAYVLEFDEKPDVYLPYHNRYQFNEENGKWYQLLTSVDERNIALLNVAPPPCRIVHKFYCSKVGYLNYNIRSTIVETYEERQKRKSEHDPSQIYFKKELEFIYGKGLQERKEYYNYFCPQISYHALQKTWEELCLVLVKTDQADGYSVAADTDSIKTTCPSSKKIIMEDRNNEIKEELATAGFTNTTIGTWKFEGYYQSFVQFKRKVYCFIKPDGSPTAKFAGCNESATQAWLQNFGEIDTILEQIEVPNGVRNYELSYWKTGEFELNWTYNPYSLRDAAARQERKEIKLTTCA